MMITGSADHSRILAAARDWRGDGMAIATVVQTWRSAPCPVGTHMLVNADGRFVGSVSGGCVEGDVLQLAADVIAGAPFELRRYGVPDGAAWEVGLPCGGDIGVIVQPVAPNGFPAELLDKIAEAQSAGEALTVYTNLSNGQTTLDAAEGQFANIYAPPRRLIIIGAVEIAATLAPIAQSMGISVVLVDPRSRFLTAERFPGITLDDCWPDEAIAAHKPDVRTAIVTLSHDIKIDDPALIAALGSSAGYVAALGSKASHAARIERLASAGVSADRLARIEGPAGVAINAISAPEIALSVAAGMIRAFNNGLR